MTDLILFLSAHTPYDNPECYFSNFIIVWHAYPTPLYESVLNASDNNVLNFELMDLWIL